MTIEQTIPAQENQNYPEIELEELSQYFPEITIYNHLFDNFIHLNSRLEDCLKEVQQLLEGIKEHDHLVTILVKTISEIKPLNLVVNNMAQQQIVINDIQQNLKTEISPYYHRYHNSQVKLDALKKTLAAELTEVISSLIQKSSTASEPVKTLTYQPQPDVEHPEKSLLENLNNILLHEKLESSAFFITQLLNGETGQLPYTKQLELTYHLMKIADKLTKELGFTPFIVWQKNLLLARLHPGFNWSDQSKNLETTPFTEKIAVAKKLLEEPFKSFANLSLAQDEFLLNDVNETLTQLKESIPDYHQLFSIQERTQTYLTDYENVSEDINNSITILLKIFDQVKAGCQGSKIKHLVLAERDFNFANNTLLQYLKEQAFILEEFIAKLKRASVLLTNTKELPIDNQKRQVLCRKINWQFAEMEKNIEEIQRIRAVFASIERDLLKARDRYSLEYKQQQLTLTQNSVEVIKQQIQTAWQLDSLKPRLLPFKNDPVIQDVLLKYTTALDGISEIEIFLNQTNTVERENFINTLETKKTKIDKNFQLLKDHFKTLNELLVAREAEALRNLNQEKLSKVQKTILSLDKEVQALTLDSLQSIIEKYQSSAKMQHQIRVFEDQQKLFFDTKQIIESLTIDTYEFSQLDDLNHNAHETLKNMKATHRRIKNFKPTKSQPPEQNSEHWENPPNKLYSLFPQPIDILFKQHWQHILFSIGLFSFVALTALMLSGGLAFFATLLAEQIAISTPLAGAIVSFTTAGIGATFGLAGGCIGTGFITTNRPFPEFWKNHWRDVLIGTAIGLASVTAAFGFVLLGCATFGIGPLTVLSAIGSATAVSLTVFGADITTAAGVGIGFGLITSVVAAISASATAFIAAIFDGKRKQLPPPSAQPPNQLTEVINPDIDPDRRNTSTHNAVNKKLFAQQVQTSQKPPANSEKSDLTETDIATLLASFEPPPLVAHSPHGFHNNELATGQNDPVLSNPDLSYEARQYAP